MRRSHVLLNFDYAQIGRGLEAKCGYAIVVLNRVEVARASALSNLTNLDHENCFVGSRVVRSNFVSLVRRVGWFNPNFVRTRCKRESACKGIVIQIFDDIISCCFVMPNCYVDCNLRG